MRCCWRLSPLSLFPYSPIFVPSRTHVRNRRAPIQAAYESALNALHVLACDTEFTLSEDHVPTPVLIALAVLASIGASVSREHHIRSVCAGREWLQISITDGQLRTNVSVPHGSNRTAGFVRLVVVLDSSINKVTREREREREKEETKRGARCVCSIVDSVVQVV
jgi:hypothetical protein